MPSSEDTSPRSRLPAHRHWAGFLASGIIALSCDAAILEFGTRILGLHALQARLMAIALAMVAGWLAHRKLTFAVSAPPSLGEFLRYAAVGWTTAAVNYSVFAALLLVHPTTQPLAALVVASFVATFFAYVGMRYGAFRGRHRVGGGSVD